jgi:hypothetical protein
MIQYPTNWSLPSILHYDQMLSLPTIMTIQDMLCQTRDHLKASTIELIAVSVALLDEH